MRLGNRRAKRTVESPRWRAVLSVRMVAFRTARRALLVLSLIATVVVTGSAAATAQDGVVQPGEGDCLIWRNAQGHNELFWQEEFLLDGPYEVLRNGLPIAEVSNEFLHFTDETPPAGEAHYALEYEQIFDGRLRVDCGTAPTVSTTPRQSAASCQLDDTNEPALRLTWDRSDTWRDFFVVRNDARIAAVGAARDFVDTDPPIGTLAYSVLYPSNQGITSIDCGVYEAGPRTPRSLALMLEDLGAWQTGPTPPGSMVDLFVRAVSSEIAIDHVRIEFDGELDDLILRPDEPTTLFVPDTSQIELPAQPATITVRAATVVDVETNSTRYTPDGQAIASFEGETERFTHELDLGELQWTIEGAADWPMVTAVDITAGTPSVVEPGSDVSVSLDISDPLLELDRVSIGFTNADRSQLFSISWLDDGVNNPAERTIHVTGQLPGDVAPDTYQLDFILLIDVNETEIYYWSDGTGETFNPPIIEIFWEHDFDLSSIVVNVVDELAPPVPMCGGEVVTVNLAKGETPTNGDDVILGTHRADVIHGLGGNDIICGLSGNDTIRGGRGSDTIYGGADDDTIYGNRGHDTIDGGGGNDLLYGRSGSDTILGRKGDDTIRGGSGRDTLLGNAGDDHIHGGRGADDINGGIGNDVIRGGRGDDILRGAGGDDTIRDGLGLDTAYGNTGSDNCTAEILHTCES